jgi:hypothetical protein
MKTPEQCMETAASIVAAMLEQEKGSLVEAQIKTLKDNQVPLTDEERAKALKAKVTWHKGPHGEPTCALKKSVVRGKTYYWSNTHRCYQCASTLKKAIQDFHRVVAPSA